MSSNDRIIPGPAGRIQLALGRRPWNAINLGSSQMPNWQTTQEYLDEELNRPDDGSGTSENSFVKSCWLEAVEFAKSELFMFMTEIEMDVPITPLNQIVKRGPKKPEKIVGVIETVESSLDKVSFKVMLKDPTGSVRATIHKTAVWEKETRDMIKVGAVLVLQNVSVFCPYDTPSLNITGKNLVRVYVEDGNGWYRTR